ncbi:MAG TPA: CDP-alcohol phosphatidyltransferase family protein [Dongiaceae bacterium]|jgi:phosphatidylglycerophosphate synthase|nr:CDP-alcohol phosphatidyltransferase family protein [Dongiaceae bacterium]
MILLLIGHRDAPLVFGLTVLERHVRAVRKAGFDPQALIVEAAPSLDLPDRIDHVPVKRAEGARLAEIVADEAPVLLLEANSIVDWRLIAQLGAAGKPAIARDGGGFCAFLSDSRAFAGATIAETLAALPAFTQEDFRGFIAKLRRTQPFYILPARNEDDRSKAERFLFWSNYKGSTDLFTRYVYPPLVWLLLRPLARLRVDPNIVTWISVALTLLAVPLFALGHFTLGFICAYGMSVLDSVDGKLARLTFADSKFGHYLDHGLDVIHPPLWYFAWAIGLARLSHHDALPAVAALLCLFYVMDRLILLIYPTLYGRGLHNHARIDALLRAIIARRNINLPLFTAGYYLGVGEPVYFLILFWTMATCLYHGLRTVYVVTLDPPRLA